MTRAQSQPCGRGGDGARRGVRCLPVGAPGLSWGTSGEVGKPLRLSGRVKQRDKKRDFSAA